MKKLFACFVPALLFACIVSAQNRFRLNYMDMDERVTLNASQPFGVYYNPVNEAAQPTDSFFLNWCEVVFDSFVNFNYSTGAVINNFNRANSTVRIDSFRFYFGHINNSGTNNSIIVSIYQGGLPTGITAHDGTLIWSQTRNTTTSLSPGLQPNGLPVTTSLGFAPNITLPQGEYFSIRVRFNGVIGVDDFQMTFGYADRCNNTCAAYPSYIPNAYTLFNTGGGTLLFSRTPGTYYDCLDNNVYDPASCEAVFHQNFDIDAYVSVTTTGGNLTINPTASATNICSPQNVTLNANPSGGVGPYAYFWNGSPSVSPTYTANVTATTTYTVSVSDLGTGQTVSGSVTVNMRSISVNAGSDRTVSCPSSVTLTASVSGTTAGATYVWNTGSQNSSITPTVTSTANYSVTVTNPYGCSATDAVNVSCTGSCNPPAPIGQLRFTPGYDNINCINQNQAYSQIIYFEIPATIDGGYPVGYAKIDSISNMPCGISYTTDKNLYTGGETGCITFTGTTSDQTGSYKLIFYLTVDVLGTVLFGDLTTLLGQLGEPDLPYYLKVKTQANSCVSVFSMTPRFACNSPQQGDIYISMEGTHNVCSGTFYDSGGPNSDYGSFEDYTITLTSANPGQQLRLAFLQLETEYFTDYLRVYDGTTTSHPLINEYYGSHSPFDITSSSGSLTFRFTSDVSDNYPGWRANISCLSFPLSVSASDETLCKGSSVQLMAQVSGGTGSYTYAWSPSGTLNNSSVANPVATPLSTTTYTVTVSDGVNSVTATSTVTVFNPPNINAGPDQYVSDCDGDISITATTNSTNYYYVEWDNGYEGLTNPDAHPGTNTVIIVDENSCTASDQVNVFLTGSSQILAFTAPATSCLGSPVTFTNTSSQLSGWTWQWDFGDGTSANTSNSIHNYASEGDYTVTLRGDSLGCQLVFSREIYITSCSGSLSVVVSGSTEVCSGGSILLTAIVTGGSGNYSYWWTPSQSTASTYLASPITTTTYSVQVSDGAGNSNIASHTITIKTKPFIIAGADVYICPGGQAQLSTSAEPNLSYSWQPQAGLTCTTCANPSANPSATTTYTVTVTAPNGCTNFDDVTVFLNSTAPALVTVTTDPEQFCGNQSVVMTAVMVNAGTNPTITWKRNGTEISSNATVSGNFAGNDVITVDIVSNLGCADPKTATFTVSIPQCTGIRDNLAFGNISIFPNPNEGDFTLQVEGYLSQQPITLQLLNIEGKVIHAENIPAQASILKQMKLPHLDAGLYLLRLSNGNGHSLRRIAVNK